MDIKKELVEAIASEPVFEPRIPGVTKIFMEALGEIERLEGLSSQVIDLVQAALPNVGRITRHTIILEKPLPALVPGDSILIQVLPSR